MRSANLQTLRRFATASSFAWLHLACGRADDGESDSPSNDALVAACGSSLEQLSVDESDVLEPYSDALASWWAPGEDCFGVLSGECADGKRLLYRNGGFVSEVRYYDGEAPVGVVSSGDLGFCPSPCPFSHFFGSLGDVACEAPQLEELCPGALALTGPGSIVLPFANGEAPGGCDE